MKETCCDSEGQIDLNSWQNYGLSTEILDALKDLNFNSPTTIQELTLPAAILGMSILYFPYLIGIVYWFWLYFLGRRDILGAAETGSGKTLAFGLPILTGILKINEKINYKSLQKVHKGLLHKGTESDSEESDFENEINENGTN